MGLFKDVKKPVIKAGGQTGGDISPLRPRYLPKTPPCVGTCPGGTDIRGWLTTIAQAEAYGRTPEEAYELAWGIIAERNPFPAVCGRVCPHPCEEGCNRTVKEGAVAINALERFVGDFGLAKGLALTRLSETPRDESVAVIGAGPAGLSCAYQLARRGYPVTVYEAFAKPGGMLRYGIPRYRLPAEVLDAEIQRVLDLGVDLRCSTAVGRDVTLDDLRRDYKAVFVGIGAHKGLTLGIPGEDASNVFTGTEFLNHVNSGEPVEIGDSVIVIGGGDTAIDAARVSHRLGARVTVLYRRTRAEMPAIKPEIEGALEEGVQIEFLAAPVEILRNNGRATGMRCIRMDLGAPDKSGRPRPVPRPGSEFDVPATAIVAAISQEPDFEPLPGLREGKDWIKADGWGATSIDGVFSGGDDIGLGLVSIAIGQGRFAAEAIDARLRGTTPEKPAVGPPITPEHMKPGWYQREHPSRPGASSRRPAGARDRDRAGPVGRRGARRSQALHVVRTVHGLRNLLDVLHEQRLRETAEGGALPDQARAV